MISELRIQIIRRDLDTEPFFQATWYVLQTTALIDFSDGKLQGFFTGANRRFFYRIYFWFFNFILDFFYDAIDFIWMEIYGGRFFDDIYVDSIL